MVYRSITLTVLLRSGGQVIHLTPTEYDLLCELTRNAGKVLTHRELLQRVWGPEYSDENTYLRTFVRHLRRKLEPDHNPAFCTMSREWVITSHPTTRTNES